MRQGGKWGLEQYKNEQLDERQMRELALREQLDDRRGIRGVIGDAVVGQGNNLLGESEKAERLRLLLRAAGINLPEFTSRSKFAPQD
jgi:hypothetical protein